MKKTRFLFTSFLLMASFFVVGCNSQNTAEKNIEVSMEWVDLGLPSGLLWASCNVGASSPEDYGDYFAWGETQPKNDYSWESYRYAKGDGDNLTKYCDDPLYGYNGFADNLSTLLSSDDAAAVNVAGSRMPTAEEWRELIEKCKWKYVKQNGVDGYRVLGPSGKILFLPAAGGRWLDYSYDVGSNGGYWSSSLYEGNPYYAWGLGFGSDVVGWGNGGRDYGYSVRPVRSAR